MEIYVDPVEQAFRLEPDIKHVFEVKLPGQLRGVSAMASLLTRLRDIGEALLQYSKYQVMPPVVRGKLQG